MVYLDRHDVTCGDDGLLQFKLERPSEHEINYKYSCLEGINSESESKDTGTNDWGRGNTIFLDRHNVDCGKKPIAQFKLTRPQDNTIRYDYKCSKKEATGACRDVDTGFNDEHPWNIFLDRHNVICEDDEVVTRFQLKRNGSGKFRYDYKCCKM